MDFTNAFVHESLRMASFVHTALPHWTSNDIKVGAYVIPAKTTILANLYHVMHDPEYWTKPDTFNPERFLDSLGKFCPDERVIPFSVGKRQCAGIALAEMQLFLFLTGILQHFQLINPPAQAMPRIDICASFPRGMMRTPPKFKVIFKPIC